MHQFGSAQYSPPSTASPSRSVPELHQAKPPSPQQPTISKTPFA
ncbi:MAG: hypothetical protein DRP63_06335 [Planctomycetota bacterium]|nr:MAG: hypothetical protein DRP63_06335 [Planctomycetota bacterium]